MGNARKRLAQAMYSGVLPVLFSFNILYSRLGQLADCSSAAGLLTPAGQVRDIERSGFRVRRHREVLHNRLEKGFNMS